MDSILINWTYWYRGLKCLKVLKSLNDIYYMSNGDKLRFDNTTNSVYLNNNLIYQDADMNIDNIISSYKNILIKKGYKFYEE